MEFTQTEIEAMRAELACNAIEALIRNLGKHKGEAIDTVARHLHVSSATVRNFRKSPPSPRYTASLVDCAKANGVHLYVHQFFPTKAICINWLGYCHAYDKGTERSRWTFKHWDKKRDMRRVSRKEAA